MKLAYLLLACLALAASATEPTANSIPVIAQRLTSWMWSPELLCELSWKYFDGFEFEGYTTDNTSEMMLSADSIGLAVIVTSSELHDLSVLGEHSRAHRGILTSNLAYFQTDALGDQVVESYTSPEMQEELDDVVDLITSEFAGYGALWCWKLFDEAPTTQRGRWFSAQYDYYQYFPNVFMLADSADTAMTRTDSASVYSWTKWFIEQADAEHPVTTVFAGMPKINLANSWAGFHHDPGVPYASTHADIVRAFCNMRFQDFPMGQGSIHDNFPEMLQIDIYPFRLVGTAYQDTASYTPALGDELNTWLLDHAETGMDSTFLPATWEGVQVHYFPQAFGAAGGEEAMWEYDSLTQTWEIGYDSYLYRIPAPAEFLMLVNVALMHQAKGFFPYCMMSYSEGGFNSASLLDYDMVPWDAPFEEYCYRSRAQDSLSYVRPDYFPPFQEGFDPLYDGPGPIPSVQGERAREAFLEWKFAPYGRLWRSMGEALAGVARIAPELSQLQWWDDDGHPDAVDLDCEYPGENFVYPECRIFEGGTEDHSYILYVNRYCGDTATVFGVSFLASDLPFTSPYLLDHDRRVIIPNATELDEDLFGFMDTLGPGEARLLELIDEEEDADLRITEPDVFSKLPGNQPIRHEFDYTAGHAIEIYGTIYNLGTDGAEDLEVTLTDLTTSTVLDRDTVSFAGLDVDGYVPDSATAGFGWTPDAGDIGLHLLQIDADQVGSEDDSNNAVSVPFLIEPRDYATEVREDPWDMEEATSGAPAWKTNDIENVAGNWASTAWTDSISGMFEGALDPSSFSPHRADISLAIPSGRDYWIDADDYHLLSFAGTWFSPYLDEGDMCSIYVKWMDADGNYHGWFDISFSGCLKSGWHLFREVLDIDLAEIDSSWTGRVKELWIRFQTTEPTGQEVQVMPVRLSWVRLEESGD
jgi:hypothetical protein